MIEEAFDVVSHSHLSGVPPKLAPIEWDRLNARHLDGAYTLRNTAVCLGKGAEFSFCCPGLLHASVVLLHAS